MNVTVKVEGLKGLEEALSEFAPKLVRKSFRQAMQAAAAPQVAAAKSNAPVLAKGTTQRRPGELRDSIAANVKVTKSGARARVGPTRSKGGSKDSPGTWGLMVEFGTIHNAAEPYLRPAFEATKNESVDKFAEVLKDAVTTMGQK